MEQNYSLVGDYGMYQTNMSNNVRPTLDMEGFDDELGMMSSSLNMAPSSPDPYDLSRGVNSISISDAYDFLADMRTRQAQPPPQVPSVLAEPAMVPAHQQQPSLHPLVGATSASASDQQQQQQQQKVCSCVDMYSHMSSCPMCKYYHNKEISLYQIIIGILSVVIIFLLVRANR